VKSKDDEKKKKKGSEKIADPLKDISETSK